MPTKGALAASFHNFEAEDGTVVYQWREWYKTAGDARGALDRLIERASRVTKQGMKKDAKGHVIGRRAELVFNHGRKTSPEMVIAWTDGSTFVTLRCASLPLLLDFESQFYP